MSHLGRWMSALVDGELDGDERDRVLNHVAGCQGCRQEANAMRALKRRLTALGETSAEPAIARRLIELAMMSQPGPEDFDFDLDFAANGPAGHARSGRPGIRLLAASAGCALAAVGTMAFLLGSTPGSPAPRVTPSVDSYLLQHAYDAGQAPAGSGPATTPAPAYAHSRSITGPALGRPEQSGPGPVAAFAASGAASVSPSVSPAASPGAARTSPSPVASHRPG